MDFSYYRVALLKNSIAYHLCLPADPHAMGPLSGELLHWAEVSAEVLAITGVRITLPGVNTATGEPEKLFKIQFLFL